MGMGTGPETGPEAGPTAGPTAGSAAGAGATARERLRSALIIVDLQPDFMPGGPLAVAAGDEVVGPIAALVRGGRFGTVVATQDWHPTGHVSFASRHGRVPYTLLPLYGSEQMLWPDHCVQGTPGAALHEQLPREPLDIILRKGTYQDTDSYSAFRENIGPGGERRTTGLAGLLKARGVERVYLCGLARDVCVAWSAVDAANEGFEVVVIDDLCRAVFPDRAAETDATFAASGIEHGALADGSVHLP